LPAQVNINYCKEIQKEHFSIVRCILIFLSEYGILFGSGLS
jgi:hypothetical protein